MVNHRALVGLGLGLLAGCGGSASSTDAGTADAEVTWARYVIEPGDHDAIIEGGGDDNPVTGFVPVTGRDYELALDPSAEYVLIDPVEPGDQLDWNKLPGLSDCGGVDLSADGAMFGWRWRIDVDPMRLEITAYANVDGVHAWSDSPLVELSADELAAAVALRYRVWPDADRFRFAITGAVGARVVDVSTELARGCPDVPLDAAKWAAGLYFGGTSVAPSRITAVVREQPFAR
jgi:hypothetical protein